MTKIRFCDGEKTKIDLIGHAEFNPGNDIVCSAISSQVYTFLEIINEFADANKVHGFEFRLDSGDVHISFEKSKYHTDVVDAAIHYFLTGIGMIAAQYPENVEVTT